jgi:hypothetical protein
MGRQNHRPRESRAPVGNKTTTETERLKIQCNEVMARWNQPRRREWYIWCAKFKRCEECRAEPFKPCLNLVDLNQKALPRHECRQNKNPHDSRIDWKRLRDGLRKRGYFRK